jgi:hypothetical protein
MLKIRFNIYCLIIIGILSITARASADRLPREFPFQKKNALSEWQEKIFKGRVFYSIKVDKNDGYLSAHSENAASGIFYEIRFDPKQFPMVSWQWQVLRFPSRSGIPDDDHDDDRWIEEDDYAARVYVIFPRFSFNLTKCLEYVWDKALPAGTIITSPYSDNIKLFVVESGKKNLGQWVYVRRNIYQDYKKAFGRAPGNVGAIAIMTDTDNTQSTAEAYYRQLKVGYKDED